MSVLTRLASGLDAPGVAMGVNIWAFRVGNYVLHPAAGWSRPIRFFSLTDVTAELASRKLENQVEMLAIVAHGDADGVVQLDRDLTPKSVLGFRAELVELGKYLGPHGKLMFLSCIAASGKQGDELLISISRILLNRHIIGFTIVGAEAGRFPSEAGQLYEAPGMMQNPSLKQLSGLPVMNEYSKYSKWARNGSITKIPVDEQIKRPNYKCAWSLCPGHEKPWHRCQPAIKGLKHPFPYPG